MSIRPPLPSVLTGGTPEMGCGSRTPSRTMRSRPGRSVISMPPSGRKAIAHGCESLATTLTRIRCCSAVSNTQGPGPNGGVGMPSGACCAWPTAAMPTSSIPSRRL